MNTYQFLFNNGEKIMANGENAKQARIVKWND